VKYDVQNVYSNSSFKVTTILDDEGEPWFDLVEVCDCLGLKNPSKVKERLEEDECRLVRGEDFPLTSMQGNGKPRRDKNFVSEPGLYNVVLGAKANDKVKPFKRWVTHEVLPEIRKTGEYAASGREEFDEPQLLPVQRAVEVLKCSLEVADMLDLEKDDGRNKALRYTKKRTGIDFSELLEDPEPKYCEPQDIQIEYDEDVPIQQKEASSLNTGVYTDPVIMKTPPGMTPPEYNPETRPTLKWRTGSRDTTYRGECIPKEGDVGTPTSLGKLVGSHAIAVNAFLKRIGYQTKVKESHYWKPTVKGKKYCMDYPWRKGYTIMWDVTHFLEMWDEHNPS